MTEHTDDVAKLAELTKDIRIAMLTTVDEHGSFTARPMAQQQVEPDGSLWFFAERDAHVVTHITANPHVGVALSSGDSWVSINGTATVVDDLAKKRELWNTVVEAWLPQGAEDPNVVLIRVQSESAEYWDTPGGRVASALAFAKTKITGERPSGHSESVEL